MKKGINYLPLFILIILVLIGTAIMGHWVSLAGWMMSLLLLCEVYYLRFIK